jgi:hypothetical protein
MDAVVEATTAVDGPRQQVEAGFVAYFEFVSKHVSAFRLLFGSGRQADDEFLAVTHRVEDRMAEAVAVLITVDIDEEHRRLLANGVVGLAEATSRYWVTQELDIDANQLATRVAELAWAGLRGIRPTNSA